MSDPAGTRIGMVYAFQETRIITTKLVITGTVRHERLLDEDTEAAMTTIEREYNFAGKDQILVLVCLLGRCPSPSSDHTTIFHHGSRRLICFFCPKLVPLSASEFR